MNANHCHEPRKRTSSRVPQVQLGDEFHVFRWGITGRADRAGARSRTATGRVVLGPAESDQRIEDETEHRHADAERFRSPEPARDLDIHENRRDQIDRRYQQEHEPERAQARDADDEDVGVVKGNERRPPRLAGLREDTEPARDDRRNGHGRPHREVGQQPRQIGLDQRRLAQKRQIRQRNQGTLREGDDGIESIASAAANQRVPRCGRPRCNELTSQTQAPSRGWNHVRVSSA